MKILHVTPHLGGGVGKAHAAINFPYDSITQVRRVTGADMRIPQPAKAQKRRAG